MKITRKLLFIMFILVALFTLLPNKVSAISATEMKQKFEDLRNNHPQLKDGAYFNEYYHGYTCYAFANRVAAEVFGSSHYDNAAAWQDYYNLDNLCIGDVVEYYEPASSSGLHCFIVTNLDGDNIEVTDSNYVAAYTNKWSKGWTTKYDIRPDENNPTHLKVVWHFKDNNVKRFDDEIPKIVESGIDMSSITSTSFKVRVKATDNVGVTQVGLNIWAPNQDRVWRLASYNSNTGYWEYTIKKSNFNNASGMYDFDTYVYDAAGNAVSVAYSAFPMGSTIVTNLGDFTARIALKSNTNYVMGTNGTTNQSNVVLKTKSLSDNSQIWKFTKNSDNTYTITHASTGKVLDIDNYSNENRAKVQIYRNANTNNQKFYIMSYNGGYRIVPKNSNDVKAIDNTSGKVENGNKMELYEAYSINNNAQTWMFQKVANNISVTPTSATLKVGETKTLSKILSPSGVATTAVRWTSSNSTIATVNASTGFVTAKKAGTATITATTTDGTNLTATCRITVKLPFTDVNTNDWYYDAVNYTYSNNIVSGTTKTTFSPNEKLTRGMLVTILYNMEGRPSVYGTNKFLDVKNGNEWYYTPIVWASKNNIVSGYANGKFGPNDPITREQLAVMLNQYCKYKGKYKAQENILNKFKDANQISSFAKWGMQWATGTGVITGTTQGMLNPQGTATRAEAISMIYKYSLNIK